MNSIIAQHLAKHPNDPRREDELTWLYGQAFREQGTDFDQLPEDFRNAFLDMERERRPGKIEESLTGLKRGGQTLLATASGAGALAADAVGWEGASDYLTDIYHERTAAAAEHAPSVQSYKDAETVGDWAQYLAGLTGEVVPSVAESVVTGLAGAGIGTAVGGPAGGIGGTLTGFAGKNAVKGFLRSQLKRQLGKEFTEEAIEDIVETAAKNATRRQIFDGTASELTRRGIAQETADQVVTRARRAAAASTFATGAVVGDSMAQNAGQTYGELIDANLENKWDQILPSLSAGAISGLLDSALPLVTLRRLGFGQAGKARQDIEEVIDRSFKGRAGEFFKTLSQDMGTEGVTESLQEAVQAYHVAHATGEPVNGADLFERMVNAGIAGTMGGVVMGGPSGLYNVARNAPPQLVEGNEGETFTETFGDKEVTKSSPWTDEEKEATNKLFEFGQKLEQEYEADPDSAEIDLQQVRDRLDQAVEANRQTAEARDAFRAALDEANAELDQEATAGPETDFGTTPAAEAPLPEPAPAQAEEVLKPLVRDSEGNTLTVPASQISDPQGGETEVDGEPTPPDAGSSPAASTVSEVPAAPSQISNPESQIGEAAQAPASTINLAPGTFQFTPASELSTDPAERNKQLAARSRAPKSFDPEALRESILDLEVGEDQTLRDFSSDQQVAGVIAKFSTPDPNARPRPNKDDRKALRDGLGIEDRNAVDQLLTEIRDLKKNAKQDASRNVTRNAVVGENPETGEVVIAGYYQGEKGQGQYRVHNPDGPDLDFSAIADSYNIIGSLHFPDVASDNLFATFPNREAFEYATSGTQGNRKLSQAEQRSAARDQNTLLNERVEDLVNDGHTREEAVTMARSERSTRTVSLEALDPSSDRRTFVTNPEVASQVSSQTESEPEALVTEDDVRELFSQLSEEIDEDVPLAEQMDVLQEAVEYILQNDYPEIFAPLYRRVSKQILTRSGLTFDQLDALSEEQKTELENEAHQRIYQQAAQAFVTSRESGVESVDAADPGGGNPGEIAGIEELPPDARSLLDAPTVFDQSSGESLTPHEPPLSLEALGRELEKAENPKFSKAAHLASQVASTFRFSDETAQAMLTLLERMNAANPVEFLKLDIILSAEPPEVLAKLGFTKESHRGAYIRGQNAFWVNTSSADNQTESGAFLATLHEMGHWFIDSAVFPQAAEAWYGLSDDQRAQAWSAYTNTPAAEIDGAALRHNMEAMHEWAVGQFTRIVRGGPEGFQAIRARMMKEGVPESFIDQLYRFYLTIRNVVTEWIGDSSLSSKKLDEAVTAALGLSDDPRQQNLFDNRQEAYGLLSQSDGQQAFGLPASVTSRKKADPERDLRLGYADTTGYERPDLILSRAWSTWDSLREAYTAVLSSLSEHHSEFVSEQSVSPEKFFSKFTYGEANPSSMLDQITGKGDFEQTPLSDIADQDTRESVAHYAAMELSKSIERNADMLANAQSELKTVTNSLEAMDPVDDGYQAKMQKRGRIQREVAARQDIGRAYNRRLEDLVATYEGTAIGDIIHGTHIPDIPSATSTREDFKSVEFDWEGQVTPKHREMVNRMAAWLKAPGNRTNDPFLWNTVKAWHTKLGRMAYEQGHHEAKSFALRQYFAPLAQRLSRLGLKATSDANRQLFTFQSILDGNRRDAERLGRKSQGLRRRLIKKMGFINRPDYFNHFKRIVDTPAKKYMEQPGATFDGLFSHLQRTEARQYLNPETKGLLQEYLNAESQFFKLATEITARNSSVTDTRVQVVDPVSGETRSLQRRAISQGTMTFMVRPNRDTMGLFVERMRPRWAMKVADPESGEEKTVVQHLIDRIDSTDLDELQGLVRSLFVDDKNRIVSRFLEPLIYKEKAPAFYKGSQGGEPVIATSEEITAAWREAQGDVVQFFGNLNGDAENLRATVKANLESLGKFFDDANALITGYERKNNAPGGAPPHIGIDARQRDNLPSGWLDYRVSSETDNRILLANIAFEGAFGKDGVEFFDRLDQAEAFYEASAREWRTIQEEAAGLPSTERKAFVASRVPEANERRKLEQAEQRLREVRSIRTGFRGVFQSELGPTKEMGTAMELFSMLINGVLNGVRSAWVQFNSTYFPILFYGRSSTGMKQVWDSNRYAIQSIFGSFFEALGLQVGRNNELLKLRRDVLGVDPDAGLTARALFDSVMGDMGRDGDLQGNNVRRVLRGLNAFYRRGYKRVTPEESLYASFNPGAPFRTAIDGVNDGAIMATWNAYNALARRALDYIQANIHLPESDPRSPLNPNFKFKAKDLGYTSKLFGLIENQRAFEQMTHMLQHDVGSSLEQITLDAYRNPRPGGWPFTKDQYQRLASIAMGYITSEGNFFTTRSVTFRESFGRFLTPVIGWSIQQPHNFARMFKSPEGDITAQTIMSGLLTMGTLILPATLGFSMFMDEWDERVMGKKSSLRPLFTGDVWNNAAAVNERFARWGPMGIPAELGSLVFNVGGEGGDTRTLSLDQRVLLANSLRGLTQAVGTLVNQGDATYASVYRPILSSMGGNGFLQNFQMASNLLGADNFETRVNQRTNANNWLRAYGKAANLEVQSFSGGYGTPNAMTPHVTNMMLASFANDRESFINAYRMAIAAAKKEGKADPVDSVNRSFGQRHPLKSVFRVSPTPTELQRLLRDMPEQGRQAVSEALRLYNAYGESIGVSAYQGKKETGPATSTRASLSSIYGGGFY